LEKGGRSQGCQIGGCWYDGPRMGAVGVEIYLSCRTQGLWRE
jgi:hypothetical protein